MTNRANGTFEVKLNPQGPGDQSDGVTLGTMSIDKQFQGDLEGTSKGQMLTAGTAVEGSAGYVAVGLAGRMTIKIDVGNHSYEFEYTLP